MESVLCTENLSTGRHIEKKTHSRVLLTRKLYAENKGKHAEHHALFILDVTVPCARLKIEAALCSSPLFQSFHFCTLQREEPLEVSMERHSGNKSLFTNASPAPVLSVHQLIIFDGCIVVSFDGPFFFFFFYVPVGTLYVPVVIVYFVIEPCTYQLSGSTRSVPM